MAPDPERFSKTSPIDPDSVASKILDDVQGAMLDGDPERLEDAITRSRHTGVSSELLARLILITVNAMVRYTERDE